MSSVNQLLKTVARIGVCCALLLCGAAQAQDYPAKPVRIIVPFAPGGGTDLTARLTAQKLSERFGQQFIVENRSGAGGVIGSDLVAKAKPDGYTLVVVSGSHTINPSLYKQLPYDTLRDFAPVTNLVAGPALLVVHPSVPANNVKELIALAKAKPGTLSYASSGNGSPPHLGGELFKWKAGVDMIHVPYKGNGPAYADLVGGQVSLMFPNIATSLQYVQNGRLRALAVTSRTRLRVAPEIPTVAEAGLPGYELNSWFGLLAPAGTPPAVLRLLQQEIAKIYQQPEVREKIVSQGVEPVANTPADFAAEIKAEMAQWAALFKAANIKPE
jgi:tripartite-type tricarboxylate transporter receptor subunit TctC